MYGTDLLHELLDGARGAREQDEANQAAFDAGLRAAAPELFGALVRARSFIAAKVSPAEQARGPVLALIDAAIAKARQA